MPSKKREEYTNALLAKSLQSLMGKNFEVEAETKGRADRKLPDIAIRHGGMHIVLEAKYDDFDAAAAAARARWHELNPRPDMVGAVSYAPAFEREFADAVRQGAKVEFALSGDADDDMQQLRRRGEVYDLAQALRRPHAVLGGENDEVEDTIGMLQRTLAYFVGYVKFNPGIEGRLATLLQANRAAAKAAGKEREALEQSAKMAGLILFGAMMFHAALANKVDSVRSPHEVLREGGTALRKHWEYILEEINYASIFRPASRILYENLDERVLSALLEAAVAAVKIAQNGVDLMGRIYHRLLVDAKTLGAFYTTIPAATMMAGLALDADDWPGVDWADAESVGKLRVADPACGSGTLLVASAWQMLDNFSRAHFRKHGGRIGGEVREDPHLQLNRLLLEETIWGYDILETAAHLTAATLGLISPETDFNRTHIYRAIIGDTEAGTAAGSLELLESTQPIFHRDMHIESGESDLMPPLHVCIMNPPFVRGTAGNESFAFLPPREQENVQSRVRTLGRRHGFASGKGQGAGFIALACLRRAESTFIRPGGRLATILPATAAVGMGGAWRKVRATIAAEFDLETVIVSRDYDAPNFSESTNLQECILIARRRRQGEAPSDTALFVVLHNNPASVDAALATMRAIRQVQNNGSLLGDLRFVADSNVESGPGYIGQYARLPWHGRDSWGGVAFAHMRLAFAAESFAASGDLQPYCRGTAPLCKLGDIAEFGGTTFDLYLTGATSKKARIAPHKTRYAAYYPSYHKRQTGIGHKDSGGIAEHPHCYVLPLPGEEDWIDGFYRRAGRIVLNHSFRFNTARRLAALLSAPVQASHYWPISLHDESEEKLKTMTLWLNATPALLLIASRAQSTQGAKVGFSQAAAKEMPVLDLSALSPAQLQQAARVFDDIAASEGLLPLPMMTQDEARRKIDDAFSEILGLGDLTPLRAALAIEPIITGKALIAGGD